MTAPSPAVRALVATRDPSAVPALIIDRAAIAARMQRVARVAGAHGLDVLFALKALPHPAVLTVAQATLAGLDVAGPHEHALLAAAPPTLISLADPGRTGWHGAAVPARLCIDVETPADVAAARAWAPHAELALRLSVSTLTPGDAAVGALAAGDGHRRSRFGVEDAAALHALVAATGRTVGLHAHSAGVARTSPAAWAALVHALRAQAAAAALTPIHLNLGGGWHGVLDTDDELAGFAACCAAIRAAAGELPVRLEPGRALTTGGVWGLGHVRAARDLHDRALRVTSLSRAGHLRWSPVRLIAPPPPPGRGVKVHLVGPTCFEDDVVGEWIVAPDATGAVLPVGTPVLLGDVSGYAVAWNTSFAGVPAAEVLVVG